MLHLLLAGIVMISGSQTTSTTTSHGRVDPVRGGAILKLGVQITHATPRSPVTPLDLRKNVNGMPVITFVRVERPRVNAGCQSWMFWP
ncbi:MAG TPA: hypothetical protein VIO32_03175 [Candidatus Baltobacteraceae bacterium]